MRWPQSFEGLSAEHTDAASATATRDFAELVELGALARVGERRYARYHLTIGGPPEA